MEDTAMKIAITGASGFVARNLIALLLEDTAPREIRAIVRDPRTALRELPAADLDIHAADVTRAESLRGAFDGCEMVVHTVAIPTERKAKFADVNVYGTEHVVAEAERAGVRRLVHLSAIGADPDSPFPFLRSKGRGERAVTGSSVASVALRPSILFGPGDDFFPKLGFSLRFPVVPVPGNGAARFQPLHVQDLALVLRAALRGMGSGVHEIGGPDVVTYDELLSETMSGYRTRRPRLHLPVPLMKPAAALFGLVLTDPPVTVPQLDLLKVDNVPARNDIERVFGIAPRAFRGGLAYLLDSA
ncbi:MAG: NAD(P)H-binding protein [Chloroflexota bacterium]|nr:NAD(P)H-binding protein [Chloroflexota bacterium]